MKCETCGGRTIYAAPEGRVVELCLKCKALQPVAPEPMEERTPICTTCGAIDRHRPWCEKVAAEGRYI